MGRARRASESLLPRRSWRPFTSGPDFSPSSSARLRPENVKLDWPQLCSSVLAPLLAGVARHAVSQQIVAQGRLWGSSDERDHRRLGLRPTDNRSPRLHPLRGDDHLRLPTVGHHHQQLPTGHCQGDAPAHIRNPPGASREPSPDLDECATVRSDDRRHHEVGLGKAIEATLEMTQRWSDGRRRILVVAPASLRKQWVQELADKFFLPAVILETKLFNAALRVGVRNPFEGGGERSGWRCRSRRSCS